MDTIIGSMTALVTPFKNGKLDLEKYETLIKRQIANGVDVGGAGDQGIMVGYACNESKELLPLETILARKLIRLSGSPLG